jgi:predicted MFS family arabinose efflux permease
MYVLLLVGIAWIDLAGPALTGRLSPGSVGASQGFLMGGLALGAALGSLFGGWMAESVGFQTLPWIAAIGAGIGFLLGIIVVRRPATTDSMQST